ncbi:MalY/PatB family protein [Virgibacillus necropolis]|uniref:cysteine-S-conjugate beta-lyase n=1 Tax=Virgibacillus necropolis TaxID=163877 RepID=A0A221MDT7_9BACI|nr:MalY/PatB family protein [Virgibacillus necropolis]ASN05794.1 cystathionine beta-lyase [Virgibacillus necropolis]
MRYDFDQAINRYNTNSVKWDKTEKLFGDKDILPMWIADMDFACPKPVVDAIKARADHGIFGYTARSQDYFGVFIDWVERRHNWSVEKRWIRCTPGIMTALSIAIQSFTDEMDKIIIQTPVYTPFTEVIEKNNRELVLNPLNLENERYEMDYEGLEKMVADTDVKMLILCNPHNPVGRVWSKEELMKLGEICMDNDVLVVSDEAHMDIVYKGSTHTPFASISGKFADNSITCTAPSKTFNLAGVQMANNIIPNKELRNKFTKMIDRLYLGLSNTFGITAVENAYKYGEEWFDQFVDYLEGNLNLLTEFIETNMKEIKVIPPEGTYLVWLDCRELGMDGKALEDFMRKKAKIAFDEGYTFGVGGEGFTRVNIACSRHVLKDGLRRIERAVKESLVRVGKEIK